jgi:serine/threonine protein kinase
VEWPLKHAAYFEALRVAPHHGVLLYGPPNNGKTLLAKAVTTECNAHFELISGPEVLSKWIGESEANLRKLFGRAAILYETLTGRPPFHGKTPIETLLLAHTEEPIRPDRLQRGLPPDLVNVCLKALAKEPNKRYPTALAFAEDLSSFLQNSPVTA